ncbi:aminoglycoside phosphotransferase family protein [Thiosocius teredinicola]|uniref:aminoglycoside phosphotransferase family protein n=1 Tax=Thiosocius teredinicola TaxID=1973002 RepID=UPI000990DDF0
MPERLQLLEQWLRQSCCLTYESIAPASSDASFRRYFRVTKTDGSTWIAMDAPPDKEDCAPFVKVAAIMQSAGVHVPRVLEQDLNQGFLLLEDLGSTAYLDVLTANSVEKLYADALQALLQLQAKASSDGLPVYDETLLRREMALFPDWLLATHLELELDSREQKMLTSAFDVLAESALEQPRVFVHRDYHSRNLMVVDRHNPGVIDFQDAVAGAPTYDLVSLLRDCYVRWPGEQVDRWASEFAQDLRSEGLIDVGDDTFLAWFDLMGVQRHLKASGIFARLNHRDGKPGYLADIPRTLQYIVDVGARRPSMRALADFVEMRVLSRMS